MTDRVSYQPPEHIHREAQPSDELTAIQESVSDLHFPQITIKTSLQSLIAHSISSPDTSAIPTMLPPGVPLSESWTAVSDTELSHEDDRHSENTDVGSLLDVHTQEDVHSIDGYDNSSNGDEQEDQYDGSRPHIKLDATAIAKHNHAEDGPQFLPSVQTSAESSTMIDEEQTIADSIPTVILNEGTDIEGDVKMKISFTKFKTHNRPALVLLIKTPSVPAVIKHEVLRKVGAMLVAGATDSSSNSSCYHVVPSDFGPGAKLESSELIPIGTQMLVREAALPISRVSEEDDINPEYILKDGSRMRHHEQTELNIQNADGSWHRPDLLVVLVSAYDACNYCNEVKTIAFGAKDYIPVLIVQSEFNHPVGNAYLPIDPNSLHKAFKMEPGSGSYSRTPVDARAFDYLDSEQLNRHVQFLRESLMRSSNNSMTNLLDSLSNTRPSSYTSILPPDQIKQNTVKNGFIYMFQHHDLGKLVLKTTKHFLYAVIASSFAICLYYVAGLLLTKNRVLSLDPALDISQQFGMVSCISTVQPSPATVTSNIANKITRQSSGPKIEKQVNIAKACSTANEVMHLGPKKTILLPDAYFDANHNAQFEIVVIRNGKIVPFVVKERARQQDFIIELQVTDFYGLVDVAFKSIVANVPICAQVDLRDTILEAVAAKLASRKKDDEDMENHHFELLSYRATKASDQSRLGVLKAHTIQPMQSMEHVVEKALVRQSRACYQNQPECFIHQYQEYRDLFHSMTGHLGCKVRNLANDVLYRAAVSLERISEAMPGTDSVSEILKAEKQQMSKVLYQAQGRAKKLVNGKR